MDDQVELIYRAYPRKVAKGAATKSIRKALTKVSFDALLAAVDEYARACKQTGKERDFIPYPATWFNQERWDDDRTEWWRGGHISPRGKSTVAEHNAEAFREVFGDD